MFYLSFWFGFDSVLDRSGLPLIIHNTFNYLPHNNHIYSKVYGIYINLTLDKYHISYECKTDANRMQNQLWNHYKQYPIYEAKRTDSIRYPGLIIRSQQKIVPVLSFHRLLSSHFILKTKIGSRCLSCIWIGLQTP